MVGSTSAMLTLISLSLRAHQGFARVQVVTNASAGSLDPSFFPKVVVAPTSRLNGYVESKDGQLALFERSLPSIAAHVSEFFGIYNVDVESGKRTKGDVDITAKEIAKVFKDDANSVTAATGLEGTEPNKLASWMCLRYDKDSAATTETCKVQTSEVSFDIGAGASGFAVANKVADPNADGKVDHKEAFTAALSPVGMPIKWVNLYTTKLPAAPSLLEETSGVATGQEEYLAFNQILALFDIFKPGESAPDKQLDKKELHGCILAPLLLNAFHLLDDPCCESTDENGDGELELTEVNRLLSTGKGNGGSFYAELLGDGASGLDPDGNNKLAFAELSKVGHPIARRCHEMLTELSEFPVDVGAYLAKWPRE